MKIEGLRLNENGLIDIPEGINKIRFDIGLSFSAPNSAVWLNQSVDTFVIGVEPNKFNIQSIKTNGLFCKQKNIKIPYPNDRFMLLHCALDNVSETTEKEFYHMDGDPGVSSLLEPTSKLHYKIREVSDVVTTSFKSLLDLIPYDRFEYVELVKTDTQGKDLDIIKSCGDKLDKIVYLNSEVNTFEYYHNNNKPNDFNDFILSNNFEKIGDNSIVDGEVVDSTYFNKKYDDIRGDINYFVL
jgi:hypothetical protein